MKNIGNIHEKISVIIATRDRANELGTISLPSLACQKNCNFEVIVWDASRDEESLNVVNKIAFDNPGLDISYYKAPRAGLPAQRNDAVKVATGEIVFFIDDDSRVSPDGIHALQKLFSDNKSLVGGCLPLHYNWPTNELYPEAKTGCIRNLFWKIYKNAFFGDDNKKTLFGLSGYGPAFFPRESGLIDFLWGCDMAFRKIIFTSHRFEERLQRFAAVAPGEDEQFSHRLHREGFILAIAPNGLVTHLAASGNRRGSAFNEGRISAYNYSVLWRTSIFPFNPFSVIPFLWTKMGALGLIFLQCFYKPWQHRRWSRFAGYIAGLAVFIAEEFKLSFS